MRQQFETNDFSVQKIFWSSEVVCGWKIFVLEMLIFCCLNIFVTFFTENGMVVHIESLNGKERPIRFMVCT